MRRFLALTCAVAFLLPAIASSAQEKRVQFVETHLQMSERAPTFHGKVKADDPVCIAHRTILLYKEEAGPPTLLGKDHSNGRGAWKVKVSHLAAGKYYAKAKPSMPSHHIYCREDQSPGVGVASVPAAGINTATTHLRISSRAPAFHGKVESESPKCVPGRKVKMLKQKPGPDKLLGTDRSNGKGKWEVDHPNVSSGVFYARVTRREIPLQHLLCESHNSRSVVVD